MLSTRVDDALQVNEWYSLTSLAGYVILLLVGLLASTVVLAFFFVTPRRSRVTAVFLACIALTGVGAAVFTYFISVLFSLIVP